MRNFLGTRVCMRVCVFSNYNPVLLQFYAQFNSNSIQIYHCKKHMISLYFYHSIKFQLRNLCKGWKITCILRRRGGRVGNRVEHVEHPSEEKLFEHCTNCAILPRPLSHDHFCENLASLLFHSSAGERLQFSQNCHTIRTKELICMRVCVFSNYNPSLKSMLVNDRHKSVKKSLLWNWDPHRKYILIYLKWSIDYRSYTLSCKHI